MNLKIGWSSHWFSNDYIDESGVIKNQREVPIIKELLKRDIALFNLSLARSKFAHKKLTDCSGEFKRLPGMAHHRAEPGIPIFASYAKHVLFNYIDYGMKFPKLDILIMNGFPLFPQQNLKFYLLLTHYSQTDTTIIVFDSEIELLRRIFTKKFKEGERKVRMTGADKLFPQDWYKGLWKNVIFAYPVNEDGIEIFKKYAPEYNYCSYFFPWDKNYQHIHKPNVQPRRDLVYIGNDTGRRKIFAKYFSLIPNMLVIGGGRTGEDNGYPENFQKKFLNIKFRNKMKHKDIMPFYRNSLATISLPKPRYEEIGFQVGRWNEAVMNGCILLLPEEFNFAEQYVPKFCIVNQHNLEKKLLRLKLDYDFRYRIWRRQKKKFKQMFSPKAQVDSILAAHENMRNIA